MTMGFVLRTLIETIRLCTDELQALLLCDWSHFVDAFGAGKEQRRMFHDRVQAVVRIRNPLAHTRAVPVNELNR